MIDSTLKNANILIIDDQESNIELLEEFFKTQGFENIQSTTNPLLTAILFESFQPDLILLDLMMPQMSGLEVLEQLKTLIPAGVYLPVVVLTADVSSNARQRSLVRGARDFITKPFDFVEVLFRIRNLLETRYYYLQMEKKNKILEEKIEMVIRLMNRWNKD